MKHRLIVIDFWIMAYWSTRFFYISTACQIIPKCILFYCINVLFLRKLYCIWMIIILFTSMLYVYIVKKSNVNQWTMNFHIWTINYYSICVWGMGRGCPPPPPPPPLDFFQIAIFGPKKASNLQAKPLDFWASNGENIRVRGFSPPPPPTNETGPRTPMYISCTYAGHVHVRGHGTSCINVWMVFRKDFTKYMIFGTSFR